ncbi:hypothetical protein K1T71_004959 [Dendrolimus kikuchii]|uniref:Uncharacterized protein n=1 Tax=Dendrolimus kikuchii TaxID=765133 RepID=A0ACC1D6T6_9NEOP|nr:hypothetical protein K1T71_004959 [Dendrolimus kikuchii]
MLLRKNYWTDLAENRYLCNFHIQGGQGIFFIPDNGIDFGIDLCKGYPKSGIGFGWFYAHRSGRPVTDKIDVIFEKVEQDRHISSYNVAGELGIDHKTVLAHLKKAGYTKKLDIWVPHELTERNLMNRVLICDSLLRRNETEPFLKKLITGDEKWITYDKNVRKRSWQRAGQASQTVAKPWLTRNKVMLCMVGLEGHYSL